MSATLTHTKKDCVGHCRHLVVKLIAARDPPAQRVPVISLPGKEHGAALHGKEGNGQLVSKDLFHGKAKGEGVQGVSRPPKT